MPCDYPFELGDGQPQRNYGRKLLIFHIKITTL